MTTRTFRNIIWQFLLGGN